MTRIYLGDVVIWNKNHLPNEENGEAMALLKQYVGPDVPKEAAEALSAGIDVVMGGKRFFVELSGEERRFSQKR